MKRVYICSPCRGDTKTNIENARKYCRAVVELGYLPIAPHLFFQQFMDYDVLKEHESSMNMARELLFTCDEIWVFGKNYPTVGMKREMNWAIGHMPVLDGFEMIGENKKKSTICDASDNELVGELQSRIRNGRIEIVAEVHQGGSNVRFEVRK